MNEWLFIHGLSGGRVSRISRAAGDLRPHSSSKTARLTDTPCRSAIKRLVNGIGIPTPRIRAIGIGFRRLKYAEASLVAIPMRRLSSVSFSYRRTPYLPDQESLPSARTSSPARPDEAS